MADVKIAERTFKVTYQAAVIPTPVPIPGGDVKIAERTFTIPYSAGGAIIPSGDSVIAERTFTIPYATAPTPPDGGVIPPTPDGEEPQPISWILPLAVLGGILVLEMEEKPKKGRK